MMFKLGGFTTLNVLTEKLSIAQPTVSNRVSELEEMSYIRKNPSLSFCIQISVMITLI
ncbi:MAG: hypothetical protein ACXAEU_24765 [Candidatus Hodarchaeales archaeon]|jgi:Mn-dependent DtxR family transcriptional regulator